MYPNLKFQLNKDLDKKMTLEFFGYSVRDPASVTLLKEKENFP